MKRPRQAAIPEGNRARALAAIKQAELFLQCDERVESGELRTLTDRLVEEGKRVERASSAMVLALLAEEYVPCDLLRAWASRRRFQQWRDAAGLDVAVIHGRLCVRPSDFFAHWRGLPSRARRKAKIISP